ncbi:MAG: DUF4412 domain-containing protein [Kiritimatiellae bacterium]|nr:DUF4412 domain-containing protein [Kiritimatiellia bacterium]MDD5523000.1 DUF4412 domain-containing protein [Kiritimatiellia bacterium]
MKNRVKAFITVFLCLTFVSAYAQVGGRSGGGMGGPQGPRLGGSMAKLFGKNSAYTATLEMQTMIAAQNQTMTMPGKVAFDSGNSRFEMDMSEAKGGAMPPQAAVQMKTMGMDKMIFISRPDRKVGYMIYPNLNAYAETPIQEQDAAKIEADYKLETTKLGTETVDGHPCVKNKAVVTDDKGNKHESIIWNATDLKDFPVKIETVEQGNSITMLFKDVKLSKPNGILFEPPADSKRYDNPMVLMQTEMMKRMGGGAGLLPKSR